MSNPEFEHFENDDVPNHNTVLKPTAAHIPNQMGIDAGDLELLEKINDHQTLDGPPNQVQLPPGVTEADVITTLVDTGGDIPNQMVLEK